MKILSFFIVLLLSVLSLQAQDLDADVTALGEAWEAALENGDAAAMAATYADEVELVNEDGSVSTLSRAEVQANWVKTFQVYSGSIELNPDVSATLLPDGKVAMTGTFTQTMTNQESGESSTVKGTENFLRVISETPSVKKVVFIASVAAVNTDFPLLPVGKAEGDTINEADPFYFSEESHPYAQAKFLAHQAVDQFIADHPDSGFEITTVSPAGVLGMAMSKREDSTSMGLQYLFKNRIAPNPFLEMLYEQDVYWANVDVEDVAAAVYQAAIRPNLHGKNYLLSSESYRISDILLMLNKQPAVRQPVLVYQNERAKAELGVRFRPLQETLASYG